MTGSESVLKPRWHKKGQQHQSIAFASHLSLNPHETPCTLPLLKTSCIWLPHKESNICSRLRKLRTWISMMTLSMSTPMKRAAISKMPSDSRGMKTNMTFLSWAGGKPWIVSSTPCTSTGTAAAGQRKQEGSIQNCIYTSWEGEWKREEGGGGETNITFLTVFRIRIRIRIRIHRIHMFLGLPDPDPLLREMDPDPALDPDPDPSIIMQK